MGCRIGSKVFEIYHFSEPRRRYMTADVMVVGAGFMGAGIAQVWAQSGYRVFLMDTDSAELEKAIGAIKWSVERKVGKGFYDYDKDGKKV